MTYSETRFREYLKKIYNDENIYIKKIPDKKQTGLSTGLGLPDYIVISHGTVEWYEVKLVKDKKYNVNTFNLDNISDSQWIEFTKMTNAGAVIHIAIYLNKELYIVPYQQIQFAKIIAGEKSIHKTILGQWRIKWQNRQQ